MSRKDKLKLFIVIVLVFGNIFLWYVILKESSRGVVTVAFLDVGQGDAIFIEGPTGNQILIDGGPNKKVLQGLGKVMPFYDRSIDLVVATHPDADHITGLVDVVSKYYVSGFMEPGVFHDTAVWDELKKIVSTKEIKNILARRGMRINLGRGAYVDILFPDRDVFGLETNDASIILRLVYGESEVLLSGDSSQKIENYLVSIDGKNLEADILKAGHHGSKTSSSVEFLSAVNPEYFIVSAGKDNRYGHPHREVLDLAEKMGIQVLRTDEDGSIVFDLGVSGVVGK